MRTVRDVMTVDTLHIGPDATVHAAVLLLRTHGRTMLPVMEDGQIAGVVDAATLFMYQPDIMVSDIMAAPASTSADAPLSAAAAMMRSHCLAELPVVDEGLVGVLLGTDLLSAWAMPVDPLTGLPWQDSFRLRSSMQLSAGNELTLLFFDMDDFGALNKRFGHIVGDRALQTVATALKQAMEPATDEACRFGGDEFVVSTTRPRPDAELWAATVRDTIVATPVEGLEGHLGVSIGVSGGLRQTERPGSHAPATLDDLINRASQASTKAKEAATHMSTMDAEARLRALPHPTGRAGDLGNREGTARPARIRIQSVSSEVGAGRARADVRLEYIGVVHTGVSEGPSSDESSVVAEAATNAVARFLPSRYLVQPTQVLEQAVGGRERVMMALVRLEGPFGWQNLIGVADVASDPRRAAVKAVLDALNRPLEALAE